jgi:toxin ParE1/3/4
MRLRYTERAIADLEAIQDYVAQHNPRASAAVGKRIRSALELLADFPGLGRMRDDDVRVLPIVTNPYVVYYSVDERAGEVVILHVRHGRRQLPKAGEL